MWRIVQREVGGYQCRSRTLKMNKLTIHVCAAFEPLPPSVTRFKGDPATPRSISTAWHRPPTPHPVVPVLPQEHKGAFGTALRCACTLPVPTLPSCPIRYCWTRCPELKTTSTEKIFLLDSFLYFRCPVCTGASMGPFARPPLSGRRKIGGASSQGLRPLRDLNPWA